MTNKPPMTDTPTPENPTPLPFAREQLLEAAIRLKTSDGSVEIDHDAKLSIGEDAGCYVQAWVWIYYNDVARFHGVDFDDDLFEEGAYTVDHLEEEGSTTDTSNQ